MTDETLDSLLSGGGNAPETEEKEVATQVLDEGDGQKQEQIEAEQPEGQQGQRMVPHEALHAEKQKVKRYTEEVADFRKQLSGTNAAWERRMADLVKAVTPKQEAPPKPDWFENPEVATQHAVQSTVSPQFEQINQQLLAIARDNAETRFTPEVVSTAEQEFIKALQSQTLDPADYQKVVSSPNRYAAAVQWHKQQQAKAEIGDDPAAFRAKLEAEILAKHGLTTEGAAAEVPAQPKAPVMPSNLAGARNVGSRSGPAWSGPPSLQDIFDTSRPA